jgi:hypothetical protein
MSDTLDRVIEIVSHQSGVSIAKLSANSAIDQDVRISGDDVTELAETLTKEFGEHVWQWPWQRFTELSEPHMFTGFWFIWRLLTWPIRRRLFDPSPFERLELGHIAAVLENGQWFDP